MQLLRLRRTHAPKVCRAPRRYRLSGKTPHGRRDERIHELAGWSTTRLVMEAARRAAARSGDGSFSYREVRDQLRQLVDQAGVRYPHALHTRGDDASRILHSRFGDLHRGGVIV
jgi:hypothetical protein